MHDFELSDEHAMILDSVRRFVQDVVDPNTLEYDEHRAFARAGVEGLAELGLYGMLVGDEHGGAGLGMVAFVAVLEALGGGCGSTARVFLTQAGMSASALEGIDGGAEILEQVMAGEQFVAWVGPEFGISAVSAGQSFALDGRAPFVAAALEAGRFLVAATFDDGEPGLFVAATDGVGRVPAAPLGYRAAAAARVSFESLGATLIARGDDAAPRIAAARLVSLIGGAALAVGSARRSIELAARHGEQRIAFGKPLLRQQAVGHKLVESRRRAEAARHLTWYAARLYDRGEDALDAARLARISAVDAAVHAADEAIQIHGGYGYTVEYHVERHYRDAKTLEVLDGGTDALRDGLIENAASFT